jgi:molybdenum cofactor cytidylyltransferase
MTTNNCALVLAAGFSKRYGSDKRFSGSQPLILKTLKNIINSFDTIYLVHRNSDEKIIELLKDLPINLIQASSDNICLGTSISIGFEHIKKTKINYDSCAIFLADMPFIKEETIHKLQSLQKNDLIIRPKFEKKPGHPVFFGSDFFDELINIKGKEGASCIIKKNSNNLKMINVQDKGILQDIDYPTQNILQV